MLRQFLVGGAVSVCNITIHALVMTMLVRVVHKTHTRSAASQKAMRDPAIVKRLSDIGTESVGSTAAELDKLNRAQFKLYRDIVQSNKALLEQKPAQ